MPFAVDFTIVATPIQNAQWQLYWNEAQGIGPALASMQEALVDVYGTVEPGWRGIFSAQPIGKTPQEQSTNRALAFDETKEVVENALQALSGQPGKTIAALSTVVWIKVKERHFAYSSVLDSSGVTAELPFLVKLDTSPPVDFELLCYLGIRADILALVDP